MILALKLFLVRLIKLSLLLGVLCKCFDLVLFRAVEDTFLLFILRRYLLVRVYFVIRPLLKFGWNRFFEGTTCRMLTLSYR